jgi:hypothetical protein
VCVAVRFSWWRAKKAWGSEGYGDIIMNLVVLESGGGSGGGGCGRLPKVGC